MSVNHMIFTASFYFTLTIVSQYPTIVRTLIDILNQEKNGRVADNICAAFCRMIGANINGVPMEQVKIYMCTCSHVHVL